MANHLQQIFSSLKNDYSGLTIGIACAEWNAVVLNEMLQRCIETLQSYKVKHIEILKVPGSFEIPFAAKHLCCELNVDAVIALGCIIKGETMHDIVLANSVTDALMQLNISQNKPVILGVLTVNNQQQAVERVNGVYGDKGKECAEAALRMCEIARMKSK
jgi:6,7-dimethyl-8-ribityllumazine synthase